MTLMLCTGALEGCRIGNTNIVFDENIAVGSSVFTVNGKSCSLKEAKVYLCNYKNLYGTAYNVDLWKYDFGEDSLEAYVKDVTLDELSRILCMEQVAKEQGITLTEEEKSLVKQAAKVYYESLNDIERSYMGVHQDDLEDYYTRYALAEKLYDTMTGDITAEVSDDEARIIHIYQMYVSDQEQAKAAASKLEAGSDFVSVAGSYNELTDCELTIGRGVLPEEIEEIAFNLNDGETATLISYDGGYYFLECISKYEEELTEANKAVLLLKKKESAFQEVYGLFVEDSSVKLNEGVWNKVSIADQAPDITTNSFFAVYEQIMEEES